jgi:S-adenosylmethionine-diacylglycerol 3-amino-3-carboxypropyl transferase
VAWLVRHYIDEVARVRPIVERLLEARDLAEQGELYRSELRPRLLGERLLGFFGSPVVLALLGVPPAQRRLVVGTGGSVGRYIAACLDHVMSVALLRDNYFWRVYITGGYAPGACPEYLKPHNFERLQHGLVDNVATFTSTVTAYLARERGPFSAFVLLDHMDWLAPYRDQLEAEWERIFAAASPEARVIFRSGAMDASFLPARVRERLSFDPETAQALHRQDRVGTYASFHIARLAHA